MPDPSKLDTEGDDDVVSSYCYLAQATANNLFKPLNIVKEKAQLDRSASQRASSASSQPPGPIMKPPPSMDILGDVPTPPARPSTTEPSSRAAPPKASAPNKPQVKQGDSLLGLDFFGGPPSAPTDRPSSASGNALGSSASSRPDLKQSILSLYASAPKPQAQPQPQHDRQSSFGGMQSPPTQSPPGQHSSFGGLDDAFSGLNFSSTTSPPATQFQQQKADPFATFTNAGKQRSSVAPPQLTSPTLSGGGFFDTTSKPAAKPAAASKPSFTAPQPPKPLSVPSDDFGDFSFASSPPKTTSKPATTASNNLFGLSSPSTPTPAPTIQKPSSPSINLQSAFNLSAPAPPQPKPATVTSSVTNNAFSSFSNSDAWGSNDAWATPDPVPTTTEKPAIKPQPTKLPSSDLGWGTASTSNGGFSSAGFGSQAPPKVTADEDFGGWSSAAPVSPPVAKPPPNNSKPSGGGFGGSDDLFSNVWE